MQEDIDEGIYGYAYVGAITPLVWSYEPAKLGYFVDYFQYIQEAKAQILCTVCLKGNTVH